MTSRHAVVVLSLALGACGADTASRPTPPHAWQLPPDGGAQLFLDGAATLPGPPESDAAAPRPDASPSAANPCTDVPATHPYAEGVLWAVKRGLVKPSSGRCNPEGTITRAEMAEHLVIIKHGNSFTYPSQQRFTDVPSTHERFRFVQKLAEDKITAGCNVAGTAFCPSDLGTNAHTASLTVRMKYNLDQYTLLSQTPYYSDVPTTYWGFKTIQKMHEDKVALGCGGTQFCPEQPIKRGEWAMILFRYFH